MVTQQEHDEATVRSERMLATVPHATRACYDPVQDRVHIDLSSGFTLSFDRRRAQGIEHATPEQLTEVAISPSGYGVRFPRVDADLWVPAMLEGVFGSKRWEAEWAASQRSNEAA